MSPTNFNLMWGRLSGWRKFSSCRRVPPPPPYLRFFRRWVSRLWGNPRVFTKHVNTKTNCARKNLSKSRVRDAHASAETSVTRWAVGPEHLKVAPRAAPPFSRRQRGLVVRRPCGRSQAPTSDPPLASQKWGEPTLLWARGPYPKAPAPSLTPSFSRASYNQISTWPATFLWLENHPYLFLLTPFPFLSRVHWNLASLPNFLLVYSRYRAQEEARGGVGRDSRFTSFFAYS